MTAHEWVTYRKAERIADTITTDDFDGIIVYQDESGEIKTQDEYENFLENNVDSGLIENSCCVIPSIIHRRTMEVYRCNPKRAFEIAKVAMDLFNESNRDNERCYQRATTMKQLSVTGKIESNQLVLKNDGFSKTCVFTIDTDSGRFRIITYDNVAEYVCDNAKKDDTVFVAGSRTFEECATEIDATYVTIVEEKETK